MSFWTRVRKATTTTVAVLAVSVLASCATTGESGSTHSGDSGSTRPGDASETSGGSFFDSIGAAAQAVVDFFKGLTFSGYDVEQSGAATDVDDGYKRANHGTLPTQTKVSRYTASIQPDGPVRRGTELKFVSQIDLVKGSKASAKADKIEEELVLYDPAGGGEKRLRKLALENSKASGRFTTTFVFHPSADMAQGIYKYDKILYLNNRRVKKLTKQFQLVLIGGAVRVASSD